MGTRYARSPGSATGSRRRCTPPFARFAAPTIRRRLGPLLGIAPDRHDQRFGRLALLGLVIAHEQVVEDKFELIAHRIPIRARRHAVPEITILGQQARQRRLQPAVGQRLVEAQLDLAGEAPEIRIVALLADQGLAHLVDARTIDG